MTAPRKHPLPSVEYLAARIRFDGGQFYWSDHEHALRRLVGRRLAQKRHSNGYLSIRLNSVTIMVHRAIWALHYGEWPKGELDHLDGDKLNNRVENLRDGTKAQNMRNQKVRKDSTSGFPGVHFCKDKARKPWAARIGLNGTWKTLGRFATREEAIECRKREQVKYGFSERHGCSPSVRLEPTAAAA